jgi:hypothetical protein
MTGWLYRVLLGLDQLANAVAGGSPDETISSRTGRSRSRFARALGKVLHVFERDHAVKSIEYTPWGTVDPHDLAPVRGDIARDWEVLLTVMSNPEQEYAQSVEDTASRAYERLRLWSRAGGRERWRVRMEQDIKAGDRMQV